ncbi:ABC transporter B family member 1-like [Haliotis rufescens]|uniref:ABC transporter B family member 1-like n=1 Tax=Haliotis rufescens TaxID=6454 RepID=UPI00201EC4CF|nr:ABC transporter B family member 1-like [Haliotis rufescens]XP_048257048.1 ABC transporter B family member 1-like [Haliotis rufescens]
MTDRRGSSLNNPDYSPKKTLIPNGDVEVVVISEPDAKAHYQTWYSLPTLRFVNVVQAVVLVDAVLSIILWLTGGTSSYFVDNILRFHLRQSVFDLAIIATCKALFLVPFYRLLEESFYNQIQHPFQQKFRRNARVFHILVVFLSFAFLAFSATKGGLVLYSILQDPSYPGMHSTYYALVVSAACFSLLEFFMCLWSFVALRKLESIRVMHRVNAKGEELDEEGKPIEKAVDLKRLMTLAKPEAGLLTVGIVALLGSSAASMVGPLFFGKVVDAAQKSMDDLNRTVLILLGVFIGGAIAGMIRAWFFVLAGQKLVARLRKELFGSVIRQEVAFFDQNRTGELCNRLSSDTQVLQNCLTVNVSMLSRYLLQIIGSLALMFVLNPSLTGVLLAVVPVVAIGAVQYGKYMKKLRKDFQDRLADAGTQAEEALSSLRTVRMFVGERKALDEYSAEINKSYRVGKKLALGQGTFEGVIGIVAQAAVVTVLWYGGKLVYENSQDTTQGITPGILTSFLLYTLQVAMAFALLSSLYGDFMQAVGASARIFKLMDRLPEVPYEGGAVPLTFDGEVEFDCVHFTYPSRADTPVLKELSFKVHTGQMVALVGPSGGGKSTIVSLIERFYDPDSGRILLGGHDLKTLDPSWFRRKMAMVSQEPTLFASSIRENIAYGKVASDQEVEEAAKQANAHEFIMSFEDGYTTKVGERGVRLSGGQKQRIAIARALIMDPVILLLDEATSALDAESEHLVQEAIDRAMKGRTVIVIAHRLSTVRNATQVVVIDKGHIAERGTHDELLEKDGVYKRLVLRQLMAADMPGQTVEADTPSEANNAGEGVSGTAVTV